jgi:hypothetical protein
MFVKVFSRIIEKKTEAALVNLHKLLIAEQNGRIITYTFSNNEYTNLYFPTEASATKALETIEKKQDSPTLHRQRWDMPEPDAWAMETIRCYEDSTNTERLR